MKAGANVNQSDGHKTPLATARQENIFESVLKKLINADTDVNSSVVTKRHSQWLVKEGICLWSHS